MRRGGRRILFYSGNDNAAKGKWRPHRQDRFRRHRSWNVRSRRQAQSISRRTAAEPKISSRLAECPVLAHHVVLASLRMAASGRSRHEVPWRPRVLRVALHLASARPLDRSPQGASAHSGRHLAGSKAAGPHGGLFLERPLIRPPLPYHRPYVVASPKFGRHFKPFTRATFRRQRATRYYVCFILIFVRRLRRSDLES